MMVEPSAAAIRLAGEVAALMLAELDDLVEAMNAAELEVAPGLALDPAIAGALAASNRANAARVLAAIVDLNTGSVPEVSDEVPPEALEIVRTVVRRGIDFDVISQAYRRGQNVAWQRFLDHAARVIAPGSELVEVLSLGSTLVFGYVDRVLARLMAAAQQEREELLGGALARRTETVRLILDGAPVDERRASGRLGYELDRRHTAMVAWTDSPDADAGGLEGAVLTLARAVGARAPLVVPAGSTAAWAWIGEGAVERLTEEAERMESSVRLAVGPTLVGVTGFRRSHEAAIELYRLVASSDGAPPLALYRDVEPVVLAARDEARAAEFVRSTLGPLAADTATAARLRETVRVYLAEAENAPRAATRLHTHRNTVLQRVARAGEVLGFVPGERRLAVELALEIEHWLGARVRSLPVAEA